MKEREELWKKIIYFLDESLVFGVLIASIMFSSGILLMIRTKTIDPHLFVINWINIIASTFIAIIINGLLDKRFVYKEGIKPPLGKRLLYSVIFGASYQSITDKLMSPD